MARSTSENNATGLVKQGAGEMVEVDAILRAVPKLASYGTNDLAVKEAVDEIAETIDGVKAVKKELAAAEKEAVDNFKRMAKPYTDEGKSVTCYSWDYGLKLRVGESGGSATIDEQALYERLCERYGEDPAVREGNRAWDVFLNVTDPVPMPRQLNEAKLLEAIRRSASVASGRADGSVEITKEDVESATKVKPPTLRVTCSNVTKAEKSAHDSGEADDVIVVG